MEVITDALLSLLQLYNMGYAKSHSTKWLFVDTLRKYLYIKIGIETMT